MVKYEMYERIYYALQPKLDPNRRIDVLRSSNDPELEKYFKWTGSRGSTHMEEDNKIYVKIDDTGNATKGTWLEEFAHALQFLKYGNILYSSDNHESLAREYEIAICLIKKSNQLGLSEDDIKESKKIIKEYEEYCKNA